MLHGADAQGRALGSMRHGSSARHPTRRSSAMTLPSLGRLPGVTSSSSPPSSARKVAATARNAGVGAVRYVMPRTPPYILASVDRTGFARALVGGCRGRIKGPAM
jgi:hypothetical protein